MTNDYERDALLKRIADLEEECEARANARDDAIRYYEMLTTEMRRADDLEDERDALLDRLCCIVLSCV